VLGYRLIVAMTPRRTAVIRLAISVFLVMLVASACTEVDSAELRLSRTATVEPGVRAIVDNCPGPETIELTVRDEVLWVAQNPAVIDEDGETAEAGLNDATVEEAGDSATATLDENGEEVEVLAPSLQEIRVGAAPAGWVTVQVLEEPLRDDVRYTVRTEPDGDSVDFALRDLETRFLYDGTDNIVFPPDLMSARCAPPVDLGAFVRDLAVLGALGVTSAALVLVAIITLFFVVTRRFGRIKSLERRAAREAAAQAPETTQHDYQTPV